MAAFSRRMLKLIVVAGSVPAVGIGIGYRMRAVQAAEGNTTGDTRVYRACDLPIYPVAGSEKKPDPANKQQYPRNVVEAQIGETRKTVQGFLSQFQDTFDTIRTTAQTGVEHTKASIDYIQNNPGELPRVFFIALAGMGGVVFAYRGGAFRKVTYGTVAAVAAASLCYPKRTVELSQEASQFVTDLYNQIIGQSTPEQFWPFKGLQEEKIKPPVVVEDIPVPEPQADEKQPSFTNEKKPSPVSQANDRQSSSSSDKKPKKLIGDPGQSNPKDKDMYSTRS